METFLVGDVVQLKQDTGRSMELVIRSPFPTNSMLCVSECGKRIVWASDKDLVLVRRPVPVSFDPEIIQAIAKAVANELRGTILLSHSTEKVKHSPKKYRPAFTPWNGDPLPGCRLLGPAKDEPRIVGDCYWSLRAKAWCCIEQDIVEYANRDDWAACRKIETQPPKPAPWTPKVGDWVKVTKPVDCAPAHKIWWVKDMDQFDGKVMQITSINPQSPWANLNKRVYDFDFAWLSPATDSTGQTAPKHRDPTKDDLKNGPIECEVRDVDYQEWTKAMLHKIFDDTRLPYRFRAKKQVANAALLYAQCRIEVK